MPFLREIIPSGGIRAGIWQITETAEELLSMVRLSHSEKEIFDTFHHDQRKRQWLAYRALLRHLLHPVSPDITYDSNGKPLLTSGSHHISVSHAGDFAAVAYSENLPVGIDIETLRERVERVRERFMNRDELESLCAGKRLEHIYVHWCGKEALYKMNGKPEVDFRNDIYIHPFDYLCNTNQTCRATLTVGGRKNDHTLFYETMGEYMMVVAF